MGLKGAVYLVIIAPFDKKKLVIMAIDYFMKPIGSFIEEIAVKNGVPVDWDSVQNFYGKGGSLRHSGTFSKDNPFFLQMKEASNNQDLDSLYNQAIQWEANRATLNEQREYESPVAQIQRQREAGINPDLVGSGGSSSVSSGSAAQQTAAQPVVQTKNQYADIESFSSSFNAVSGFISSMSGLGSTIGNLTEKFTLLPAKESLAETSASIAAETKDDTIEGISLKNLKYKVAIADDFANMFSADSSADDITSHLTGLGYDEDQAGNFGKFIHSYRSSPQFKSKQTKQVRDAIDNDAYNQAVSHQDLVDHYNDVFAYRRARLKYDDTATKLQQSINDYLEKGGYAKKFSDLQINSTDVSLTSVENQKAQLGLIASQIDRDITAFATMIEQSKEQSLEIQSRIDSINQKIKDEGRPKTFHETQILRSLANKRNFIDALGTEQMYNMYSIMDSVNSSFAYFEIGTDAFKSTDLPKLQQLTKMGIGPFMELTYDKVLSGNLNRNHIRESWIQAGGNAINTIIGVGADFLKIKNGTKSSTLSPVAPPLGNSSLTIY